MSNSAARMAGLVLLFGFIILIVGLTVAWLGGHGYLPIEPLPMVGVALLAFCIILCFSTSTVMAGTSFIARQKMSMIPEAPREGFVSRAIRDPMSGKETIIQAHADSLTKEVLEENWPFRRSKSSDWYLIDERGNDVTNWPMSNWEGIALIYFVD